MTEQEVNKDLTDADRQALRDKMRDRELVAKVVEFALKVHGEGQIFALNKEYTPEDAQPQRDPEPSITQRVKAIFEAAREVKA